MGVSKKSRNKPPDDRVAPNRSPRVSRQPHSYHNWLATGDSQRVLRADDSAPMDGIPRLSSILSARLVSFRMIRNSRQREETCGKC